MIPLLVLLLLAATVPLPAQPKPEGLLVYHDYPALRTWAAQLKASPLVRTEVVGLSFDYTKREPAAWEIIALRINRPDSAPAGAADRGDARPAILFDAGIHPREWLTSESLIELAQMLVVEAGKPQSRVARALRGVDVWLIPMVNPAGRMLDDLAGGDPRKFFTSKAQQTAPGWRGNADTRVGKYGEDLARNFSRDWTKANQEPDGSHWRGVAPFSAAETAALRQFVQNHSIGMAVHLHANSQEIWNAWGEADRAGAFIRRRAAEVWQAGCRTLADKLGKPLSELKLELDQHTLGTTMGQYPAWLAAPSDTPGQPDFGTVRGIQTFTIELPFDSSNRRNYYKTIWQCADQDGSNSFHPSGAAVRSLIHEAFFPLALYLIEQAAAPGCATEVNAQGKTTPISDGKNPGDVGLLAAKICAEAGAPGLLRCLPASESRVEGRINVTPACDYLEAGPRLAAYWLQNYGDAPCPCAVNVRLESRAPGSAVAWKIVSEQLRRIDSLGPRERCLDQVAIAIAPGLEYQLSITLTAPHDSFAPNNRKVFRFLSVARLPELHHERLPRIPAQP